MKRSIITLAGSLCSALLMVLCSCTSDINDNSTLPAEPDQLADYTIIYYGHGGSNLDDVLIGNLRQLYEAKKESYDRVKVAIEYKFSQKEQLPCWESEEQMNNALINGEKTFEAKASNDEYISWMNPEGNSTFRFVLDPSKTLKEQAAVSYLPQENADFTREDSLTNFINWAVQQCPAKSYVLILADHGGNYLPCDEIDAASASQTRAVIFDSGNNFKHFCAKSLSRAIRAANVKPIMIYYDACFMNSMEYTFELKDATDYIIASTYGVPGKGGIYNVLVDCLAKYPNDIEQSITNYSEVAVANWEYPDYDGPLYHDMTATRTVNVDRLGEVMREFTDRLCNTYTNGTDRQQQLIDSCTSYAIRIEENSPNYDAAKYMASIMLALPEVYDNNFNHQMEEAFNNCIVTQNYSNYLVVHDYMVDFSVLLGTEGAYTYIYYDSDNLKPENCEVYNADGTVTKYSLTYNSDEDCFKMDFIRQLSPWGSTLADTYEKLEFDRIVGWSRWIKLNRQQPNLFCPSDFNYVLPDPQH